MPTEYILAYHCAPAFAGIKPSNIASCSKRENPNITVQIKMLNEKLNKNDIYINVLCECENVCFDGVSKTEIVRILAKR